MTTTGILTVPRRGFGLGRAAMTLMGLGQATSFAGLSWDYYVHAIIHVPPEAFTAPPHLLIFSGIGVTTLGFLVALFGARWRVPAPSA